MIELPKDWWIEETGESLILDPNKVAAEIDRLRAFAAAILQAGPFDGCDVDGGNAQELGVKWGVLRKTTYDPARHGGNDGECEPGDPWYEFTFSC